MEGDNTLHASVRASTCYIRPPQEVVAAGYQLQVCLLLQQCQAPAQVQSRCQTVQWCAQKLKYNSCRGGGSRSPVTGALTQGSA